MAQNDRKMYEMFANSAKALSTGSKRNKTTTDWAFEGIKNLKRKILGLGILSSQKELSLDELISILSIDLKIGENPEEAKRIAQEICNRRLVYKEGLGGSYLLIKQFDDKYHVGDYGIDEGEEVLPSYV